MNVSVDHYVNAPRAVVWDIITDIERAAERIECILDLEILERPAEGLVGLKWRETRKMFGKTAEETMWITEVDDGTSYTTEAHNHGAIYRSTMSVVDEGEGCRVGMAFGSETTTFMAKVMGAVFGSMMKGSTEKMMRKDLIDIADAAEGRSSAEAEG